MHTQAGSPCSTHPYAPRKDPTASVHRPWLELQSTQTEGHCTGAKAQNGLINTLRRLPLRWAPPLGEERTGQLEVKNVLGPGSNDSATGVSRTAQEAHACLQGGSVFQGVRWCR